MLKPHPAILRRLVEEYEEAVHQEDGRAPVSPRGQRAQDLAYTLCVTMGTRDVHRALEEARRQLAAAFAPTAGGAPVGA